MQILRLHCIPTKSKLLGAQLVKHLLHKLEDLEFGALVPSKKLSTVIPALESWKQEDHCGPRSVRNPVSKINKVESD